MNKTIHTQYTIPSDELIIELPNPFKRGHFVRILTCDLWVLSKRSEGCDPDAPWRIPVVEDWSQVAVSLLSEDEPETTEDIAPCFIELPYQFRLRDTPFYDFEIR